MLSSRPTCAAKSPVLRSWSLKDAQVQSECTEIRLARPCPTCRLLYLLGSQMHSALEGPLPIGGKGPALNVDFIMILALLFPSISCLPDASGLCKMRFSRKNSSGGGVSCEI